MTRDAEHTPATQSVVVPVSAIVGFDVEEYVEGYELRADEGAYTPTEHERGLITDAIHGVMSELSCLAAPAPSSLAGGEGLAIKALCLHEAYLAIPQDRGGVTGTKGRAHQAWIDAKDAALSAGAVVSSVFDRDALARMIWERQAPEHLMEWEAETHKAEWLDLADAILATLSSDAVDTSRQADHAAFQVIANTCAPSTPVTAWETLKQVASIVRARMDARLAERLAALSPEAPAREGVYVASRASIPERGQMWRDFRAAGVPITSTWIDEDGPGETADFAELWPRIQREVMSSERLVCYLEPEDFPVKGVLIEIGMAMAAGVPIYIVAPTVPLEGRAFRPLGSWIKHPLVRFCDTVEEAFAALTPRHEAPADPCASHRSMGFHIDPCCPHCEAPAEGAGECDRLREIDTLTRQVTPDIATAQWLLASIQEITEPALRARSSAPEAREGEVVDHRPECWGSTSYSGEMAHCYCSQSTAAPSADKLRIVKPLDWRKPTRRDRDEGGRGAAIWIAPGFGGEYAIQADLENFILWRIDDPYAFHTFSTVKAAKAHAEADWQKTITRKLSTPDALKGDAK